MSAEFAPGAARLCGAMARIAGWSPDSFWRSTPADVAAVLGGWVAEEDAGLNRADLTAMMEIFPDGR